MFHRHWDMLCEPTERSRGEDLYWLPSTGRIGRVLLCLHPEAEGAGASRTRRRSTCRLVAGTVHLRTGQKFECQAHLGRRLQGVVGAVSRGMRETSARMWEIYRISSSHWCWRQ